jgi:hypothetical protein
VVARSAEDLRTEVCGLLDGLDPDAIVRKIRLLADGYEAAALLCFEKPGSFCHRALAAQWIEAETGVPVVEYGSCGERR